MAAVRVDVFLRKELMVPIENSFFWSDSMAVLKSIANSKKKFPVYVANRLAEIERNSQLANWRFVPTKLNPAEEVSRDLSVNKFIKKSIWLSGPEFLRNCSEEWPKQEVTMKDSQETSAVASAVMTERPSANMDEQLPAVDRLISHYSDLHRLKRGTAWILKFGRYLLDKARRIRKPPNKQCTTEDLEGVERQLIAYEQRRCLNQVYQSLQKDNSVSRTTCPVPILRGNPTLVDGVIRMKGRLAKAPVAFGVRCPILLPFDSHLSCLIVNKCHRRCGHGSTNFTFSCLRERFWLQKGSSLIRKVIQSCLNCKRNNAKCEQQVMANLPSARLQIFDPPFTHSGVDYFGPFQVKQGRSTVKRYGCVFTCMTTRAVHLELVTDMTTDCFVNALRRFVARRKGVSHLYSDNGSNFVGAERVLKEDLKKVNQVQVGEGMRKLGIEWSFNPPSASHFGGAWERVIRTIRKIMKSLSPGPLYTNDVLRTVFCEVENIINDWPLTPISFSDFDDRPLTPSDFLTPDSTASLILPPADEKKVYFVGRYKQTKYLINKARERWVKEYLPTIAQRSKWLTKRRNIAVGDLVYLVDEPHSSALGQLGKVIEVHPDHKGVVRSVRVRMKDNELLRPVAKLRLFLPVGDDDDEQQCA